MSSERVLVPQIRRNKDIPLCPGNAIRHTTKYSIAGAQTYFIHSLCLYHWLNCMCEHGAALQFMDLLLFFHWHFPFIDHRIQCESHFLLIIQSLPSLLLFSPVALFCVFPNGFHIFEFWTSEKKIRRANEVQQKKNKKINLIRRTKLNTKFADTHSSAPSRMLTYADIFLAHKQNPFSM